MLMERSRPTISQVGMVSLSEMVVVRGVVVLKINVITGRYVSKVRPAEI